MATIRIDDNSLRPTKSNLNTISTSTGISAVSGVTGVYSKRSPSADRRSVRSRSRGRSIDRRSLHSGDGETAAHDEDSGLRHSGDFKKKQVYFQSTRLCLQRCLIDLGL